MDPTPMKRQKLDETCEDKSAETEPNTTSVNDDSKTLDIKQGATPVPDVSGSSEKRQLPDGYNTDLRLTEKDVGITEYISSHNGLSGILKQRQA